MRGYYALQMTIHARPTPSVHFTPHPLPRCFCALKQEDEIVAVGLAVVERGYVGLYDIVTAPALRNQGLGTQLLLHLLHWGKANQAHSAYLQVMYDNAAAVHVYAKLGF